MCRPMHWQSDMMWTDLTCTDSQNRMVMSCLVPVVSKKRLLGEVVHFTLHRCQHPVLLPLLQPSSFYNVNSNVQHWLRSRRSKFRWSLSAKLWKLVVAPREDATDIIHSSTVHFTGWNKAHRLRFQQVYSLCRCTDDTAWLTFDLDFA